MSNKHERFDKIVGSMIFFLMLVLPILMFVFGFGGDSGVQPLGNAY